MSIYIFRKYYRSHVSREYGHQDTHKGRRTRPIVSPRYTRSPVANGETASQMPEERRRTRPIVSPIYTGSPVTNGETTPQIPEERRKARPKRKIRTPDVRSRCGDSARKIDVREERAEGRDTTKVDHSTGSDTLSESSMEYEEEGYQSGSTHECGFSGSERIEVETGRSRERERKESDIRTQRPPRYRSRSRENAPQT